MDGSAYFVDCCGDHEGMVGADRERIHQRESETLGSKPIAFGALEKGEALNTTQSCHARAWSGTGSRRGHAGRLPRTIVAMAVSDTPPAPPRPFEHPTPGGCAVLEPPARPPPPLAAEREEPGTAPILVVIRTKDPRLLGRRFVLDRSPFLVGRAADNHIVLQDASVSPGHAHLEERDAAWWVPGARGARPLERRSST